MFYMLYMSPIVSMQLSAAIFSRRRDPALSFKKGAAFYNFAAPACIFPLFRSLYHPGIHKKPLCGFFSLHQHNQ